MSEFFTLDNGEVLYLDTFGAVEPGAVEPGAVEPGAIDRRLTLVALHGLGGGGYFFAGTARLLAPRGRALCPDLPGSGLSRRGDRPISFDRFTDAVVQLIERKTDSPVALMGHSMGTIIALKVYARIPHRVGSMIFVGGLPAPLPEAQARLRDRATMARSAGMAAVAPTIVPVVFARKSLDVIPDKVTMFQRLLAQSDAEGYAQTALALADASAVDVAPRVRVPCLCVTGTEDRYAPPAAVRRFADSIPGSMYRELPDCGHMPFFEVPQGFDDIVQRFLSEAR
jgi:pimeloyl-ACP methyl ester carboxylesterase